MSNLVLADPDSVSGFHFAIKGQWHMLLCLTQLILLSNDRENRTSVIMRKLPSQGSENKNNYSKAVTAGQEDLNISRLKSNQTNYGAGITAMPDIRHKGNQVGEQLPFLASKAIASCSDRGRLK